MVQTRVATLSGYTPRSRDICLIGDSRNSRNHSGGSILNFGWVPYAIVGGNGRFRFPGSMNFAVGGSDTNNLVSVQLPLALASAADLVMILSSTNDRGSISVAGTIANLKTVRDALLAVGKEVVFFAEMPRGDATYVPDLGLTGTDLQNHMQVVEWLRAQRTVRGCYVVDVWPDLVDPALTTGFCLSGVTVDGLHNSGNGSILVGAKVAALLNTLFAPYDVRIASNGNLYDATQNPRGSHLANPMCTGTSGTKTAGAASLSGNVASSWTLQCNNATGLTVVAAKETIAGEEFQKITISGTPTDASPTVEFRQSLTGGNFTAGDVVRMSGQVDIPAGNSGWTGAYVGFTGLSAAESRIFDTNGASAYPEITAAYAGAFETPDIMVTTPSSPRARCNIILKQNVAASVVVRVRALAVRKVLSAA